MKDEQIVAEVEGRYDYDEQLEKVAFFQGAKWHRDNDPIVIKLKQLFDEMESTSNCYEVINGRYVIQKSIFDLHIDSLYNIIN